MEADQDYMDNEPNDIQTAFQRNFGWFLVLNRIAENDITKHKIILDKKLMEVLNQLSYIIQYDQLQQKLTEEAFKRQNR